MKEPKEANMQSAEHGGGGWGGRTGEDGTGQALQGAASHCHPQEHSLGITEEFREYEQIRLCP